MAENNPPRHPHNLQGLLRFALEATKNEDAPDPSIFQEMDPERRTFLEQAIKSMTIDVIEQLEKSLKTIQDPDASEDEQLNSLENIIDYVDNIDTANDFCKIGGLDILIPCLDSQYSTVRSSTARIIAELSQNNPFSQQKLLDSKVLPKLVDLLNDDSTANQGIHAISCMVRSYEPCIAEFIDIGGLECLLCCIQSGQEKLVVRSLFLLNSILNDFPIVHDEIYKLGGVKIVCDRIRPCDNYDPCVEAALSTLIVLVDNNDKAVHVCRDSSLGLKEKLQKILILSDRIEACQELIESVYYLQPKIFPVAPIDEKN